MRAFFAVLFIVLLAGCTQVPQLAQNYSAADTGMQVVRLSWGKFNYDPEVIHVKAHQPVRIVADTERLTGCFRSIVIPELHVQYTFTERYNSFEFTPEKPGSYAFACSMGMGKGTLVVS